jgi:hypothetical protein
VRTTLDPRLVDPAGNEPGLVVGVRDQARRKSHLTARQAGEIAALPRARKVVPFRFSPRQRGDEALLREEVAAARRQGAGERGERRPAPAPHAVVLLSGGGGLSTAAVFAEADRLGLGRDEGELEQLADKLREAASSGASPLVYADLLANDLEPAARSLRPDVGEALDALRAAGAPIALLTGSGPTAFGLFADLAAAERAAAEIGRDDAIVCEAGVAP